MSIQVFDCEFNWIEVLRTEVPRSYQDPCDAIPLLSYPIQQKARLLKIVALSFHGNTAAIQYIHIDYKADQCYICPESLQNLDFGKLNFINPTSLPYLYNKTSVR